MLVLLIIINDYCYHYYYYCLYHYHHHCYCDLVFCLLVCYLCICSVAYIYIYTHTLAGFKQNLSLLDFFIIPQQLKATGSLQRKALAWFGVDFREGSRRLRGCWGYHLGLFSNGSIFSCFPGFQHRRLPEAWRSLGALLRIRQAAECMDTFRTKASAAD